MLDTAIRELVRAAGEGDSEAWHALVERFGRLVWAVTRAHGLGDADAADVSQTVWLRLAEHVGSLREPERVGAWLATTARFESLRAVKYAARCVPVDIDFDLTTGDEVPAADHDLLDAERDAELWQAFSSMSLPCQRLLRTLIADPAPSYAEVSAALGMPVGSIGPRRARCLEHLRGNAGMCGESVSTTAVAVRKVAV